jgi:hypothetical protein
MTLVPAFYSLNEIHKPATHRVYHNNNACPPGRDIPQKERLLGTVAIGSAKVATS